jgi:hypothetical protein
VARIHNDDTRISLPWMRTVDETRPFHKLASSVRPTARADFEFNRDLYEAAGAADASACSRIGSCGGVEINWLTEKGGPRDPTTEKDAGGTPAS